MLTGEHGAAAAAYRELKRRIIESVFAPGEKLSEMRLVAELGVGRSPLRTALARLQSEGWIAVSPQSGTYVRGLSAKDISDVVEMRLVLESHMAELAAKRIEAAELDELRHAFDRFGESVDERGPEAYFDIDLRLHMAIYKAAGNELIARTLLDLLDKILWIRRSAMSDSARLQDALVETRAILEALERRDGKAARRAMRAHIKGIRDFRRPLVRHEQGATPPEVGASRPALAT